MIDDSELVSKLKSSESIDEKSLQKGVELSNESGNSLYQTLIEKELIDEPEIVSIVADMLNVPFVELSSFEPKAEVLELVPPSVALRNRTLPLKVDTNDEGEEQLLLAMADPIDVLAMDEIASHTGIDIRPVLAGPVDLLSALERTYKDSESLSEDDEIAEEFAKLEEISSEASIADDSWAAFFDEAEEIDADDDESEADEPTDQDEGDEIGVVASDEIDIDSGAMELDSEEIEFEDSASVSQEMRARPTGSILVEDEDLEPDSDAEDSGGGEVLDELDRPLDESQVTGGVGSSLKDWEIDEAIEGDDDEDENKDYAAIGSLFVNSGAKAKELVDDEGEKKEKKSESGESADDEDDAAAEAVEAGEEDEPAYDLEVISDEGSGDEDERADAPSVADEADEQDEAEDAPQEDTGHTQIAAGPFMNDSSEEDDEDEEDDDHGHTQFGLGAFGPDDDAESEDDEDDDSLEEEASSGDEAVAEAADASDESDGEDDGPSRDTPLGRIAVKKVAVTKDGRRVEVDESGEPTTREVDAATLSDLAGKGSPRGKASEEDNETKERLDRLAGLLQNLGERQKERSKGDDDSTLAEPSQEERETKQNEAITRRKARLSKSERALVEAFLTRIEALDGSLDSDQLDLLESLTPAELLYATVLALIEEDVISVTSILEQL